MPEEKETKDFDSMTIEQLEAESKANPAEKVAPEPEAEAEVQEPEPVQEKRSGMIPQDRFNEVNEARKHAEAMLARYQNDAIQRAQQVQPKATAPSPTEVAEYNQNLELLKPYLQPLYQQIESLNAEVTTSKVEKMASAAERYVRQAVPDFDSIAPEMFAEIQQLPPVVQDKILGDPDWVIQMANMVKLKKGAGVVSSQTTVKQDLKKRAVSESGGSSNPPVRTSSKIDPEYERVIIHGTTDELLAYERKKGIK